MSDLTANNCGCGCSNQGMMGGNNCLWIILLLCFCGGSCGSSFGGSFGCGRESNNCCTWIILLLLLSNCCGNNDGCGCGCGSSCC